MKTTRTRLLSMLLVLAMVLTMLPMTVFAAGEAATQTVVGAKEFWANGFTNVDPGYNGAKETDVAVANSAWMRWYESGFGLGSTQGIEVSSKDAVPAEYTFQAQIQISHHNQYATIWPQWIAAGGDAAPSYRIMVSDDYGFRVGYDNGYSGAFTPVPEENLIVSNPVEVVEDQAYILKYTIEGDTLSVKLWPNRGAEPADWNYVIEDAAIEGVTNAKFKVAHHRANEYAGEIDGKSEIIYVQYIKFTEPADAIEVEVDNYQVINLTKDEEYTLEAVTVSAPELEGLTPVRSVSATGVSLKGDVVKAIEGNGALGGEPVYVQDTYTLEDGTVYVVNVAEINLNPVAIDQKGQAWYSMYMATRKAENNTTVTLVSGDEVITSMGAVNNKTITLTGDATFALDYKFRIGSPSEAPYELSGAAAGPATLVISNANIANGSDGTAFTGFEVYNANYAEAGQDPVYYPGTLKIVNSVVDTNDIWNSGTVEVSGKNTYVTSRNRIMVGTGADVTAYLYVKDGATVELQKDSDRDIGYAGPGELILENGGTYLFNSTGCLDIFAQGTLKVDAASQLISKGGLKVTEGGKIVIDVEGMEENSAHVFVDTNNNLIATEEQIELVNAAEGDALSIVDGDIIVTRGTPASYTVTFANYDGTVLQKDTVLGGQMPVYTGSTPYRSSDADNTYKFAGWDKEIVAAAEDVVYTATFTATPKVQEGTVVGEVEFWKDYFTNKYKPEGSAAKENLYTESNSGWMRWWDNGFGLGSTQAIAAYSKQTISGDYTFQAQVQINSPVAYVTIFPKRVTDASNYRLVMSAAGGLQVGTGTAGRGVGDGVAADKIVFANTPTVEARKAYMLKYTIEGDTLYVKLWGNKDIEPAEWNYVIQDQALADETPGIFYADYFWNTGDEEDINDIFYCQYIRFTKPIAAEVEPAEVTLTTTAATAVELPAVALGDAAAFGEVYDAEGNAVLVAPTGEATYTVSSAAITYGADGVAAVDGATADFGSVEKIYATYTSENAVVRIPVAEVTLQPAVKDQNNTVRYGALYMATRKAVDGDVLTLNPEATITSNLAAINNKSVTLTGEATLPWNYMFRVANPAEAQVDLSGAAHADATLTIQDAVIANGSAGDNSNGFEIYNDSNHKNTDGTLGEDAETAYKGTLKIVDSEVDVNAIWNGSALEVTNSDLIVRYRFMIGTHADKTATVVVDNSTVELLRDSDQDLGVAGKGEMTLKNGATFKFNATGAYNIHEQGTLTIDATSQFVSVGGLTVVEGGTVVLDAAGMEVGDSHTFIDLASPSALTAETIEVINAAGDAQITIAEDGDITVTIAEVVVPTYTVIWANENGDVLETDLDVAEGTVPTYDGETPVKAEDDEYTYEFAGWDPEVTAVTEDAYYVAKFTATEKEQIVKFDFAGNNMTLGNELILNFMFKKSDLPDGEGVYAVLTHKMADGKEDKVKTVAFDAETWTYNKTYYFVNMSVYASQMADDITVVLYNAKGQAISNPKTCSVRTYLMNNIDKSTFNAKMKTVAVDMLNYGAASQEYNKYNVSDLANNLLSDTQKAYGTPASAAVNRQIKGEKFAGANLSLLANIELNIMFTGYAEGRYAEVTYTNFKGEEVSYQVAGTSYSSGKYTSVKINTLRLSDGDTLVNVVLYNADGTVYGTGSDSVDGYARRQLDKTSSDLYEMVSRLTASAKAYALG